MASQLEYKNLIAINPLRVTPVVWVFMAFALLLSSCGGTGSGSKRTLVQGGEQQTSTGEPQLNEQTEDSSTEDDDGFNRGDPNEDDGSPVACLTLLSQNQQDSDNDGISDHDEITGYPLMVSGQSLTIYTDPLDGDTDGDGKDDRAERNIAQVDGSNADLASPIALHPAMRDYVIHVHAAGGANSTEERASQLGWNSYDFFQADSGDQITVIDTEQSSYFWRLIDGDTSAKGSSERTLGPTCLPNQCLENGQIASLILRYSANTSRASDAGIPGLIDVGAAMGAGSSAELPDPVSADNLYLQLRANDRDGISVDDNGNALTIVVRIRSSDDYPQQAIDPASPEGEDLLNQLCGGI